MELPEWLKWLAETHGTSVHIVVRRLLCRVSPGRARDLAEDGVAAAHVKAIKEQTQFHDRLYCLNWVVMWGERFAIDELRRESRHHKHRPKLLAREGGKVKQQEEAKRQSTLGDFLELLAPALGSLAEEDRKLIRLRYYQELTGRKIAEQLGWSEPMVSRRLNEARKRLREILERLRGRGGPPSPD